MESIFNDLSCAVNNKDYTEIIRILNCLIKQADKVKIKEISLFIALFNLGSQSVQIVAAEATAELCKCLEIRRVFTNAELVNILMQYVKSDSPELTLEAVRALGNICYENEDACKLVEKEGIDSILTLLRDDSKREDDNITTKVSGLFATLINMNDNVPKAALDGGILTVVEHLLLKYKVSIAEHKTAIAFLLSIVDSLIDYIDDVEFVFTERLGKIVVDILKGSEVPRIYVLCLSIFHALSEKDEIKNLLGREGICELLFDLIEKHRHRVTDEESRYILKMTCDLIVLILTGDPCMDLLYNDGKGKMYANILSWLDAEDSDLLTTGILAIGNFARKDVHCIQMVKDGVAKKLIELLRKCNHSTDISDCKLQHALLSTLKNLVISKQNKPQALEDGIIEVMYPMLNQDRYMVVFKLLGTFRMVIDGQPETAHYLLSKKDFVERLVYWCYNSDHVGVRGEVPRIFSWLIKNTHSSEPFATFVSVKDSVKCIVDMIASNFGLMHNESFLALIILLSGLRNTEKHSQVDVDAFYNTLCDSAFGKNLSFALNKYGEQWDKHTIENCLTLLEQTSSSEQIIQELQKNNVVQSLDKLKSNVNATECANRVDTLLITLAK
ncbi:rap1 GTPase-GDP dissociation stimulator 1-B [Dendroctonus ponderosae]|uniref:Rap1 GTPase-GDP dissociation stimulator 1-B n=1 Tax=Dendroctonus ponderosae TaxID=77166 RepID=A0AAR5PIG9_DENPD|nr:rap1 GTPase-GDP dissociation stimulator 1-B [Dendroctonus ponderosae]